MRRKGNHAHTSQNPILEKGNTSSYMTNLCVRNQQLFHFIDLFMWINLSSMITDLILNGSKQTWDLCQSWIEDDPFHSPSIHLGSPSNYFGSPSNQLDSPSNHLNSPSIHLFQFYSTRTSSCISFKQFKFFQKFLDGAIHFQKGGGGHPLQNPFLLHLWCQVTYFWLE